ncbi:hypothetical protein JCM11641_002224 [Rhodosporidiobolus odoratus]
MLGRRAGPALSHSLSTLLSLHPTLPSSPSSSSSSASKGHVHPIWSTLPGDVLTPIAAYLRLTNGAQEDVESFLLESAVKGETAGRWSFMGANPSKVYRTGPKETTAGDPLVPLEQKLNEYKFLKVQGAPPLTGGAIGYVGYDCVHYFEPKTARSDLSDPVGIPESVFLLHDTVVAFDHLFQRVYVVGHVYLPFPSSSSSSSSSSCSTPSLEVTESITQSYATASRSIAQTAQILQSTSPLPLPSQPTFSASTTKAEAVSNVGKEGYEGFVTSLKASIVQGEIIQAVPSQRLRRETKVAPFNIYRQLRQLNPSPYMFYIQCGNGVQLVGASPECLCKVEAEEDEDEDEAGARVENHAIAGTVRRGKDAKEDASLAAELRASVKDRAEHVMLVDLARNDINRVCRPDSVVVDSLMQVEKFSHVMHLTSQVSGRLRAGLTRFDAFRSIFPAGTVSGAPKIRAIELIASLEQERRGAYAGAVGWWALGEGGGCDTCIAIRTMVVKTLQTPQLGEGRGQGEGEGEGWEVFLQAGGGIVFDSVEEDEYVETINKLGANVRCLEVAEAYYAEQQEDGEEGAEQ